MKSAQLSRSNLPDAPGVYLFKDARGRILYVGKATSLRNRVQSYFSRDLLATRGPLIVQMLERASKIDYVSTDSVLEALILEASLIKKHNPLHNSRDKDDKSYSYLVITREDYPRVLVVRGKDLDLKFTPRDIKYLFGPFPQGGLFREAVKMVRKIFPFRDICVPGENKRACFNAQIGLCPGVCDGRISKTEYGRMVNHLRLFFEGKKGDLIAQLKREMRLYAKAQAFEKAGRIKHQIFALNHIQDVTLIRKEIADLPRTQGVFRIEGYDVAHTGGTNTTGVMVVVENGDVKKSDYRKFKIKGSALGSDIAALREILTRRFNHTEWRLPNVLVVDGGKAQIKTAETTLAEYGYQIPVLSVVKNEYHRPREILGDKGLIREHEKWILLVNAEAHRFAIAFHKKKRNKSFLP